jgi:hypothetical protein
LSAQSLHQNPRFSSLRGTARCLTDVHIIVLVLIMRLSSAKLKGLCAKRGTTLGGLLREAAVSRTACYSPTQKDSVRPKLIEAEARALLARARKIVRTHPSANPDNVRHTLLLLKKEPIERLRRALIRAQASPARKPPTGGRTG